MRGTLMAWRKVVRKAGCLVEMREILTAAEITSNVHESISIVLNRSISILIAIERTNLRTRLR